MKIYYYTNERNEKIGPLAHAALVELHQQGKINGSTPVMTEGAAMGTPYEDFAFIETVPPTPQDKASGTAKKGNDTSWVGVAVGSVAVAGVLLFILGSLMLQQLGAQVSGIFATVQTRHVSSIAQTELNSNPEAKRLLGDNIQVTEIPGQRLDYDVPKKTATGKLNVRGSKAQGVLNITREPVGKVNVFKVMQLELDGQTHNLLK